mmetsp:Transcript_13510/g.19926  ORF Transcript_13510/g.19926 Transcript_13510/m.19926 type:complete len:634 (+) Transcript_13510:91-1992(+)|eukprot:CAMPEP_0194240834 /NCGR_PEP_ID=MMETSP0158-20130606/6901_1 /TAXON_ID=33649 /ORGANISM="Thalassionema nitzschioides, Strain L26-B" /LENGTH=633 /DNA_ID=CAMNT_0038975625 /DNA_START=57 /DNA_END=1958 /DNA_ORIENTATION=+
MPLKHHIMIDTTDNCDRSISEIPKLEQLVDVSWNVSQIRRELQSAISQLSQHCLKLSAKWACEQLIGLPDETTTTTSLIDCESSTAKMSSIELYAKSLMELGEYAHAAAMLSQPASHVTVIAPPREDLTQYGTYLRAYAMYLAGEQRKSQQQLELQQEESSSQNKSSSNGKNAFLPQLSKELGRALEANQLCAFGYYVYGLALKDCWPVKGCHSPHQVLLQSLRLFPYNWSAWLDYADLPSSPTEDDQLHREFGSHVMYYFYTAHCYSVQQQSEQAIRVYDRLLICSSSNKEEDGEEDVPLFCNSPYIATKVAVAHYHLREFHLAQHCFVQLHTRNPYRLDEMDVYSNILYVQDQSMALSQIAHTAMRVDKYRPETCCIVGNYYSLKSLRTKAIQYFQRALKLNPKYTGAWTLMGHEYVELKNTPAAMEAYRQAADISPKDYRAWYGLGQAYEILGMPLYALYYYKKACAVRSYDARMWSAVAGCYLLLGKRKEAILSYERALQDDTEGTATTQLAKLYQEDNMHDEAARCFLQHLQLRYLATTAHPSGTPTLNDVVQGVVVQSTEASALLFLAHYYKNEETQDSSSLETAALCASRLLEYPGPEKEEGKAVLREIRSRHGRTASSISSPNSL